MDSETVPEPLSKGIDAKKSESEDTASEGDPPRSGEPVKAAEGEEAEEMSVVTNGEAVKKAEDSPGILNGDHKSPLESTDAAETPEDNGEKSSIENGRGKSPEAMDCGVNSSSTENVPGDNVDKIPVDETVTESSEMMDCESTPETAGSASNSSGVVIVRNEILETSTTKGDDVSASVGIDVGESDTSEVIGVEESGGRKEPVVASVTKEASEKHSINDCSPKNDVGIEPDISVSTESESVGNVGLNENETVEPAVPKSGENLSDPGPSVEGDEKVVDEAEKKEVEGGSGETGDTTELPRDSGAELVPGDEDSHLEKTSSDSEKENKGEEFVSESRTSPEILESANEDSVMAVDDVEIIEDDEDDDSEVIALDEDPLMMNHKDPLEAEDPLSSSNSRTEIPTTKPNVPAGRGALTIVDPASFLPPGRREAQVVALEVAGGRQQSSTPMPIRPQPTQEKSPEQPKTGVMNDRFLEDDEYVIEAPSFVAPYVYLTYPKLPIPKIWRELRGDTGDEDEEKADEEADEEPETAGDALDKLRKIEEIEAQKLKKKRLGKDDDWSRNDNEASDDSWDSDMDDDDDEERGRGKGRKTRAKKKKESKDGKDAKEDSKAKAKEKSEEVALSYFDQPIGKFLLDIGTSLVQEFATSDLLRIRKRKLDKEGGAAPAAAHEVIKIMSEGLAELREKNKPLKIEGKRKRCKMCPFRTHSSTVLDAHLEVPHTFNITGGAGTVYQCNWCPYESEFGTECARHICLVHGRLPRLERPPCRLTCPQCPWEENGSKPRLKRHMTICEKKFRPELNLKVDDWNIAGKILAQGSGLSQGAKVDATTTAVVQGRAHVGKYHHILTRAMVDMIGKTLVKQQQQQLLAQKQQQQAQQALSNPIRTYYPGGARGGQSLPRMPNLTAGLANFSANQPTFRPVFPNNFVNGGNFSMDRNAQMQQMSQILMAQQLQLQNALFGGGQGLSLGGGTSISIVQPGSSANKKSVPPPTTIQPLANGKGHKQLARSPATKMPASVSIIPTNESGKKQPVAVMNASMPKRPIGIPPSYFREDGKPGPKNPGSFVVCEICDGYIKDMEQLGNHLKWIHKVHLHPRLLQSRPPLNCQKCQYRFFTDQGLERHLLGSHGLVTTSMQEAANNQQDAGRCPICGKMYQWKLLSHVSRDHKVTLKPAHLSYKCTVCTATFLTYRAFETHVYDEHSHLASKKGAGGGPGGAASSPGQPRRPTGSPPKPLGSKLSAPLSTSGDEVTIVAHPRRVDDGIGVGIRRAELIGKKRPTTTITIDLSDDEGDAGGEGQAKKART